MTLKISWKLWLLISILLIITQNTIGLLIGIGMLICFLLLIYQELLRSSGGKKAASIEKTLEEIDSMDGYQFELYLEDLYKKMGYKVEHTPFSGDQGADLILVDPDRRRIAVQVKNYSGKVSNKAVQEVVASIAMYRCSSGMVVTNSYFTKSAQQLAKVNDVELVDRQKLAGLLKNAL